MEETKAVGRPVGSLSSPPSRVVSARVGLWALEKVERQAEDSGLSLGSYVAELLEKDAKRHGAKAPKRTQPRKASAPRKAPTPRKQEECAPHAPCSYSVEGGHCSISGSVIVPAKGGSIGIDKIPARFCLVEAEQLQTSHNPLGGFGPRAGYPPDAQERDYRQQVEQGKVLKIAQDYEPSLIFSTAPGALDGLPVVTEDRYVLGGNGRAMATILVYNKLGGVPPEVPRDYLLEHARQFGLTKADVRKFKHPVVVRTIRAGGSDARTLAQWSRRLNAALSQQLDSVSLAVSRAKFVDPNALRELDAMGDGETLAEFLNSDRSLSFVKALQASQVIDARSAPLYIDKKGLLNADGRQLVTDLLVATLIPSVDQINALGPGAINTLARSASYLIATKHLGEYSLVRPLQLAVEERLTMKAQNTATTARAHLRQVGLFGGGVSGHPLATMMFHLFFELEDAPVRFARVTRRYLQLAKDAGRGQGGLFGNQSPTDALREAAQTAHLKL